ncbi:MAG: 7-cyano-7-deazaguanine synthase [Pelotomaculum sp. PtaU1.Bin065]|nr:MAG: 7-cyano-7-deazaguanine synthase [Pelotomaculum sp. PtaU1.Bin065]
MKRVVVLASGGLDSSTLACKLTREGFKVYGIFIDYGQSMAKAELGAAKFIATWAGFNLIDIKMPLDESLLMGCLFNSKPQPWETNFVSFFPQRNLLLLTIASMYAQKQDIYDIYIGVIKNTDPFPDTTSSFIVACESILNMSYAGVKINYPFAELDKASVLLLAKNMGLPYEDTFSCEMANDHHCMQCPSCLDRYWAEQKVNINRGFDNA